MRRLLRLIAAGVLLSLGWVAPAAAHPTLLQAAPSPGLSAPTAPTGVTLAFSEAPVARGSSLRLTGPSGRIALGPVRVDGKSLTAPITGDRLKPGIYDVEWVGLGDDGHTTSGEFRFGVAGANGAPPPGAEQLAGSGGLGTGEQSAAASGAISVVARWLLIVAAALLLGGGLLARRVGAPEAWRTVAGPVLLLAIAAGVEGVLAAATAGATGDLDFGLVPQTEVGLAALVRLVVLVLGALVVTRLADRRRDVALIATGGLALLTTAFDGHVVSAPSPVFAGLGQVVHVLAAGTWLGGVLVLPLLAGRGGVPVLRVVKAFTPLAAITVAAASVTGVIAAIREVDSLYFLQWSGYGRVVIVKSALVVIAIALGAAVTWRARRATAPAVAEGGAPRRPRLLRLELAVVVAIAAAASALVALPQGRGSALPAERGTLLAGPAFASVLGTGGSTAEITLAPARAGTNRVVVAGKAERASVRFTCACAKAPVTAELERTADGVLAGDVRLPADGTWYGYATLDGKPAPSPAALPVGVPEAPGADPLEVLAVADLSGERSATCRATLQGLQLAIGRINAEGGLDGGRKVALLAADDRGDPARAAAITRGAVRGGAETVLASASGEPAADGDAPVALAGACGAAAGAAVEAAAKAGVPALVGDPAVPLVDADGVFRVAGDPAAEAYAAAGYLRENVVPSAALSARTVRVVTPGDAAGKRLLAGWRAGLDGSDVRVEAVDAATVADGDRASLTRLLDRRRTLAVALDGPESLTRALAKAPGPANTGYAPAPVVASSRVLSEASLQAAGTLGRLGVVRGLVELGTDTQDARAFESAIGQLYPGTRPTLAGVRGYATGLALREAVRSGVEPAQLERRLAQPAPFTDVLFAPWRSDAPWRGTQRFRPLGATFLASTIIPPSQGGQSYSGTYFTDGSWRSLTGDAYGPPLEQPPLGD